MKHKLKEYPLFYRERAFNTLVESLEWEEKEIAQSALNEIQSLKKELQETRLQQSNLIHENKNLHKKLELERYLLKELVIFFGKKSEEIAKILKAPVHFESDIHLRHHYFYLRDSVKKLIMDCRGKIKETGLVMKNEKEN